MSVVAGRYRARPRQPRSAVSSLLRGRIGGMQTGRQPVSGLELQSRAGNAAVGSLVNGRAGEMPSIQRLPVSVLELRVRAGNAAVGSLLGARTDEMPTVQRQPTPGGGDPPALLDPRWADDPRFQAAYHNSPPIRPGDSKPVVAKLQQALVDAGYPMPVTMRSGTPDGRWGNETTQTVRTFQTDALVRPVGGFEAGHKTLRELDSVLRGHPAPPPVKTEPTLDALAVVGPGAFAGFVSSGILDSDAALLLAAMARENGTWMQDIAIMAANDLASGALAGMVLASNRANLTSRVPAADRGTLTAAPDPGGGAGYSAISDKAVKGFVLLGSSFFPARTAPLRFPFLVLSHELNHHRNRDQAARIERDPAGQVDNPNQYVDLTLAAQFAPGVVHTRKQYAVELQARHVAWHVAQEYDVRTGRSSRARAMPAAGALFAACFAFARDSPAAYHDNGYMPAIAAKGDAVLGRQVAIWMVLCSQMEFLNTAVASDVIGNFFNAEAALARTSGFVPTVAPDGLA